MSGGALPNVRHKTDPELPAFFLNRLTQLVDRQVETFNLAERMALGLAALSTFLDCFELGYGDQALAIIERIRDEIDLGELDEISLGERLVV